MAVTITRSIWVDDDGTGTTGTVINQALHTTLYNEIDTALAKVPQLAGGNAFTGNQTISNAFLVVNWPNQQNGRITVAADGAVNNGISIVNSNPNNSMYMMVFYTNVAGLSGAIRQISATGVAYDTTSDQRLKQDAGRATDVSGLRAVVVHDFTWKADGQPSRGVFAQEAYTVFPRAIGPGTDEVTEDGYLARPWMTDYSKFVPDLIVGWQQHDAAIAELRAALAAAKG